MGSARPTPPTVAVGRIESHYTAFNTDTLAVYQRIGYFAARPGHDSTEGGSGHVHFLGRRFMAQPAEIGESQGFPLIHGKKNLGNRADGQCLRHEIYVRRLKVDPTRLKGTRHYTTIRMKL